MPPITVILSHIPTWVWAILAALIVMGIVQSRDQLASAKRPERPGARRRLIESVFQD